MKFKSKAVLQVAQLMKRLDAANPDVGMGYSDSHWVDQAKFSLDLYANDFDREAVLAAMKK